MNGQIVQLVQGEKLKLAFDDFDYWIERFRRYPLVQLIDLDAAMRQGDNRALIAQFTAKLPCQIGGGLRTAEDAQRMFDLGAKTRHLRLHALRRRQRGRPRTPPDHQPRLREKLAAPWARSRLVFSVDTKNGRVAVKGWKDSVNLTPEEAVTWLEPYCDAFLYTHVDTEGTMQGFPDQRGGGAARDDCAAAHRRRRHPSTGEDRRARRDGRGRGRGHGRLLRRDEPLTACCGNL